MQFMQKMWHKRRTYGVHYIDLKPYKKRKVTNIEDKNIILIIDIVSSIEEIESNVGFFKEKGTNMVLVFAFA